MTQSRNIADVFVEQAIACEALGSPFTGGLCRRIAENLDRQTAVGRLCLDWQGDTGPSGESVPLRLCGGLHALVLSKRDDELARHYPPHKADAPEWAMINAALNTHEAFLLEWMTSPPQTNEVSRAAILWPALMAVSGHLKMPLRLLEVGASAGLNLRLDHFSYRLGGLDCGTPDGPLLLTPQWRGEELVHQGVKIISRAGCDLNPLDPANDHDALRLSSYCWPDQSERMQRLTAALGIARRYPAEMDKADAVVWLKDRLSAPSTGACTLIYSTIAWQYLPSEARAAGEATIRDAGRSATKAAPLVWLRFEADGQEPGAGIQLDVWPGGDRHALGRGDFHGRWVDWNNPHW